MGNLSELLLLSPDVRDAPHAPQLVLTNPAAGATVEFAHVDFSCVMMKIERACAHGIHCPPPLGAYCFSPSLLPSLPPSSLSLSRSLARSLCLLTCHGSTPLRPSTQTRRNNPGACATCRL